MAGYHPLVAPEQSGRIDRRGLKRADVGFIFQHADIHLNPIRKIGEQLKDLPVHKSKAEWIQLLEEFGLIPGRSFFDKFPFMNSGGQNQRISWLMSLAQNPKLILADEPVSNLDNALKSFFSNFLRSYIDTQNAGAVVVSHDVEWLDELADELFLLNKGQIEPFVKDEKIKHSEGFANQSNSKKILHISRLTYGYPGEKDKLLDDLFLDIHTGTITGIFGASGEGKSTLLRIIKGEIKACGKMDWAPEIQAAGHGAALIGQDPTEEFHPLFTIRDQLEEYARENNIGEVKWMSWVDHFGLDSELLLKKPATLSGGQLQRCAIIKALLSRPRLLLLDESFSGLDDNHFYSIMGQIHEILQKDDLGLVLVMHRLDLLKEVAHQCLELKNGRLHQIR
jgi:peptide/nickel transport system ATP-binding protein